MIVVSNASPLIILAKISYFHLPQRLFNKISISEDVWDEVVVKGAGLPGSAETQRASQSGWIHFAQLANSAQLTTWRNQYSLGAGELSTILLAKEIQADVALIDERGARLLAKSEGVPVLVFFNGGTVFEPWMEKALELVDGSQFEKADVICVSDGISDVSSEAQVEWTRRRTERGMRAYGILIDANQGEALLDEIGDVVFRLDDLRGDLLALEVIFSAV